MKTLSQEPVIVESKQNKNGTFAVTIKCSCGKPIIESNYYGMFCEDKCHLKEAKKLKKKFDMLFKSLTFFEKMLK